MGCTGKPTSPSYRLQIVAHSHRQNEAFLLPFTFMMKMLKMQIHPLRQSHERVAWSWVTALQTASWRSWRDAQRFALWFECRSESADGYAAADVVVAAVFDFRPRKPSPVSASCRRGECSGGCHGTSRSIDKSRRTIFEAQVDRRRNQIWIS